MATRKRARTPLKGRSLVAIGLALFVAVALTVIWRRSIGAASAQAMTRLNTERRALRSERTTLERQLSDATSRRRIVPAAERLGLHVATEAQTRMIPDSLVEADSL